MICEVTFHNDRIGRGTRKNSPPLAVKITTPSLERRVDLVIGAVEERCGGLSRTTVDIECGTHRGTIYTRADGIPIGAFTIDPPLEYNG